MVAAMNNSGREGVGTSVAACDDAVPVLDAAEDVLGLVAPPVERFVIVDPGLAA